MTALWKHITKVASWACEPIRSDALTDDVMQLQAVLDETRLRLHHEERISQELKAQVKEEQRRGEMRQREMREQLESQHEEIKRLKAELETAKAALHENKAELQKSDADSHQMQRNVSKARASETELLAALLEHATKQATACAAVEMQQESTALQQLREELEVAQRKASEEQEAGKELRQQLQEEKAARIEMEHFLDLQRESLLREFHHRKACEAEVADFLRLLGQRYPELACSFNFNTISS